MTSATTQQREALLQAAYLGDNSALAHLLQVWQPDIRRYAVRHCLASNVDDAVQEAMFIITRRLQTLRVLAAFSSWLFQIVRRECRRLERYVFGLDPYDEVKMAQWLTTQTDESVRLDLVRALESLPQHYREIILLRDFQEHTIREIAVSLGLSIAAAKSRLHRARQLIREYLLA